MTEGVAPAPAGRRGLTPARFALAAAVAALLGVGGAAGVHRLAAGGGATSTRIPLPTLNGQIVWNRGERPEPPVVLPDQNGVTVSLAAGRGRTTLVAFLGTRCGQCAAAARAIRQTVGLLPARDRPRLVVVGTSGDTPVDARAAVQRWQLPRGVHWLVGSPAQIARVRHDFGIPTVKAHVVYLIGRSGYERTGYLYPFLPNVVARDLKTLAGEMS